MHFEPKQSGPPLFASLLHELSSDQKYGPNLISSIIKLLVYKPSLPVFILNNIKAPATTQFKQFLFMNYNCIHPSLTFQCFLCTCLNKAFSEAHFTWHKSQTNSFNLQLSSCLVMLLYFVMYLLQ